LNNTKNFLRKKNNAMSEKFGNVVKLKAFGNVDNKLVKRLLDIIVEYDIAKKS